jgi:hypothetical protein
MALGRTKVAIIGADASAFHIFNKLYRSDDRFEVAFFLNLDPEDSDCSTRKYPANLCGASNERGIPIFPFAPFQHSLVDQAVEKCIFASSCVTSNHYLFLAAQCLAAGCSVTSHSLQSTQTPPSKPLVSFFADTQFDLLILLRLLAFYRDGCGYKPAAVFSATGEVLRAMQSYFSDHPRPDTRFCFVCKSKDDAFFQLLLPQAGMHEQRVWDGLLSEQYPVIFVCDADTFQGGVCDECDLFVHVGFNSLLCFFQSHLLVYACDDFTFREDVAQHPSAVILRQAQLIILAQVADAAESVARIRRFVGEDPNIVVVPISVTEPRYAQHWRDKKVLLLDDYYPTTRCNAVASIAAHLASKYGMLPAKPARGMTKNPLYYEPTEKDWPALIVPDRRARITSMIEEMVKPFTDLYDGILSAAITRIETAGLKPVLQFAFRLPHGVTDSESVAGLGFSKHLLNLPPQAFVRHTK